MPTVAQPARIIQNPSAPVTFDDYPQTPETIRAAIQSTNAVRQELGIPLHPEPEFHPVTEADEDRCTACGQPTVDHFGGCALAIQRNKPLQTAWPVGVLYGDAHLDVTRAIAYALEYECGPAIQVLYDALGSDERLMVARQLSRTAVSAFLAEMAK